MTKIKTFLIKIFRYQKYLVRIYIYQTFIKRLICYKEFTKIKKKNNILIVYDFSSAPSTYGDIFDVILIARSLIYLNKNIKLIFIMPDKIGLGSNHRIKYKIKLVKFINEIVKYSKFLCASKKFEVETMYFKKLKQNYFFNKKFYILFKSIIIKRENIYKYTCGTLNSVILKNIDTNIRNKILLSINSFKKVIKDNKIKLPKFNYITTHFRYLTTSRNSVYSMNVDKSFNTSISEAKNIISILKKNYVDKKIMVITDYVGAKYYKKKLGKIKNLYYSQDFSNNFFGNGLLILNSKIFITSKNTGICFFPQSSHMPYLINWRYAPQNEALWGKNKPFSHQKNDQIAFFEKKKGQFLEFLSNEYKFKKL